jgi:hypothetical protein
MDFIYTDKSEKQLSSWYKSKVKEEKTNFLSYEDFSEWYFGNKKECFYCRISERECQEIIFKGLLISKRFPLGGEFARGVNRGYWLEIDKMNPRGMYSRNNCVLSCYFCNNDKSDVFNHDQYKEFVGNRGEYLRKILKEENNNN